MGTPTGPLGRRYDHGGGDVRGGPENPQGLSREPVVFFKTNLSGGSPVPSAPVGSVRGDQTKSERTGGTAMQKVSGLQVVTPGGVGTSATSAVHASQLIATASARGNG